jgi:hypothetical protein
MLLRETVAVYCENHMEHTDTLCEQNAEFLHAEAGGTYGYLTVSMQLSPGSHGEV